MSPIMPQDFESQISYKIYPNAETISLKNFSRDANWLSEDSFLHTLLMRKSVRSFSDRPVDLEALSKLLTLSCGLRDGNSDSPFRTYASAGARYPIEVYVTLLRSNDVDLGIYHYNVINNALEFIKQGDYTNDIKEFYINQLEHLDLDFPCLITFTVFFERSMGKYGEKGYRFALMDSGHMSQNLYLVAKYLNLGIVALGAGVGDDACLDNLLSLARGEESTICTFAVGYPLE